MYSKQILQNGLTILKVPIPSVKSVLVDIFIKTGSRQEVARLNGISHFLEHIFYKGSKKFPTAQKLSHALDAIGAEYNANTGKEHTQFYIKAAKKHLKFIFETLADMLLHPVFAPRSIEREKGVIIEEINMYQDTPMRHVGDVLEEIMWPGHPLGRNIAGTKEAVRKITRQDITQYVQNFYQPQNMILAIAGSYQQSDLKKLIEKWWSHNPSENFPKWRRVRETQNRPLLKIESKKTEQHHLAMGFRSYHYNHPRYISQILLAIILGGGMSSRLFTEIRERQGLAYYVKTAPTSYQDTGNFVIQAGARLDALPQVVKTIISELKKIKNRPVPERELEKAKEYLKGTLTLSLEVAESLLGWYLEQVAFRREVLEPEEMFSLIDKTKALDVLQVAQEIFQDRKLNLAVIGSNISQPQINRLLHL